MSMNKEHSEQTAILNEKIETLEESVEKLTTTVDNMSSQLTRYKGFIGGFIFAGSCLVTAVGLWLGFRH